MRRRLPRPGDVFMFDLGEERVGHELLGVRPAVVLSPDWFTKRADLMVIVPITDRDVEEAYEFDVPICTTEEISGLAQVSQMRCVAWRERGRAFKGRIPNESLETLKNQIKEFLL